MVNTYITLRNGQFDTPDDYERALELMNQLVDDYDANKPLIEILAVSIERWEDPAEEFSELMHIKIRYPASS